MRVKGKRIGSILLLIMLLGVTVGYSYLSSELVINGTSKIKNATWDIHFANLSVSSGSVSIDTTAYPSAKAATIDTNDTTKVTYNVLFSKPGDYYEFTVDAVNAGSIDAMIDTITSTIKINGVDKTNNIPAWLNYSVTYTNEVSIAENQILAAGDTETYKVRVELSKDITNSQLEEASEAELQFSFSVAYKQTDGNEVEVNLPTAASTILRAAQAAGQLNQIPDTNIYIFKGGTSNPPANYVKFNCDDNGENCENWRIVGIYNGQMKIIRVNDNGEPTAPDGFTSVYWNTTISPLGWGGSNIKESLNTTYYNTLSNTAKDMIDENGKWDIGAVSYNATAQEAYTSSTSSAMYTTPWTGKVGIIASYEYLYATIDTTCFTTSGNEYGGVCGSKSNNWLTPKNTIWTLSGEYGYADYVITIAAFGDVSSGLYMSNLEAIPALFLKSSVTIASGDGTNPANAYVLQ